MILTEARRTRAKFKMCLQGPSGSGKTMSSLLVAYGLCNDWSRVAILDSENHSAELYAHLGPYKVLNLPAPFTPEAYVEALNICEKSGIDVVIIDSLTHEWEYLLDYHSSLPGNSYTAWAKVTPRHNLFIQAILQSPLHVIGTVRTKQDYVLTERNGKQVPEKVGLKAVQRDGMDYDFTLVFELDIKNNATASKDRTGLFFGQPPQKLSIRTGEQIRYWCNAGVDVSVDQVSQRIGDCKSVDELLSLYRQFPEFKASLQDEYETRKRQLIINHEVKQQLSNQTISKNGTHN